MELCDLLIKEYALIGQRFDSSVAMLYVTHFFILVGWDKNF